MLHAVFRLARLSLYCVFALILVNNALAQSDSNGYLISAGDVISVQVFDEPSLSIGSGRVGHDGTVPYPLLGAIEIQGLTSRQVKEKITRLLKNGYLKRPQVVVTVLSNVSDGVALEALLLLEQAQPLAEDL